MALDTDIVALIRDEIGPDLDFVDNIADLTGDPEELGALEDIYTDANRGRSNVLNTALICWRRRLAQQNARSFDVTKEGNWLARSQRVKFLMNRVEHYERLLRDKPKGKNATLLSGSARDSSS
ncbi:MAG: hypothetical protein R3330_20320 [Saprospiraceae bacterium]|nr:hypothetical protein [Saprospiraceae bacterium]